MEVSLPREMPGDDMVLSFDDMERILSEVRQKVLSLHKSTPSKCENDRQRDANECLELGAGVHSVFDEIQEAPQLPDDEMLHLPNPEPLIADVALSGHQNAMESVIHEVPLFCEEIEDLRFGPLCEKQLRSQKSSSEVRCKLMDAAWSCQRARWQSDVQWHPEPPKVANRLSASQMSGHCRPRVEKLQCLARNMVAIQHETEQ